MALIAAFVRRRWGALLTLLAVVPIVTAAARAVRRGWIPVGDAGLLAVRARDVGTAHHPLLGSWTSASLGAGIDLNNPGAAYDYLLAPVVRLVPSFAGVAVGVAVLNIAAVVGASLAARAIGGYRLQCVVVLASSVLAWSMGSELLIDVWQPHALLLPFLALIVLALGLSVGQARWMPWAVGLASLVVQTHVAYVYAVATLAATVTVLALLRWRVQAPDVETTRAGGWRRVFTTPAARAAWIVGLALWAQPLYEQWWRDGNLGRLARAAVSRRSGLGAENAVRVVVAQVARPPWSFRSGFSGFLPTQRIEDDHLVMGPGLIGTTAAVLVLAALVAIFGLLAVARARHGALLPANGCWLCIALLLAGVYGTSTLDVRFTGLGEHQIRWLWTVMVLGTMFGAWALAGEARRRFGTRDGVSRPGGIGRRAESCSAVVATAGVAVVTIAAIPFHAQPAGPAGDGWAQVPLRAVVDDLASFRPSGAVVYDMSTLWPYEPFSGPIMLALQARDIEFHVEGESWVRQLGPARAATGRERVRIFQLQDAVALAYDGPACLVALGSVGADLPLDEARAVLADVTALNRQVLDGSLVLPVGGVDAADRWLLGEVTAGNAVAAAELVSGGTLGRLVDRGEVELATAQRERLELGEALSPGLVAVFADGDDVCASAD